jgi:hypothetical protein
MDDTIDLVNSIFWETGIWPNPSTGTIFLIVFLVFRAAGIQVFSGGKVACAGSLQAPFCCRKAWYAFTRGDDCPIGSALNQHELNRQSFKLIW